MAAAAPTQLAEPASGVWPTGSRRSEALCAATAGQERERASPPRSRSAARRSESRRRSVDLRPGLVEALERVPRVDRRDGLEVQVALVVPGEGHRRVGVVL